MERLSDVLPRLDRGVARITAAFRPAPATSKGGSTSFNLLRWFSLLSLVCILVLSAALATVLSRFMTNAMVERDAAISAQFVESFAHAEPVWSYFERLKRTPPDPTLVSFFSSFFGRFVIEPDIIRANVYARDRTVIWSSTAALVGTSFGPNAELDMALKGQLAVELGTAGTDDRLEHVEFEPELKGERYVESYIPIWSRDRRTVVGVVEIYRLTKSLFRAIDVGTRLIWITTLAGGALLYIVLFGIVKEASLVIERQERRLVETESLAAVGEMASAVAHGIRNPLASIRSSAELVSTHGADHASNAARDIISSVDRLSEWIRSFLYQAHGDVGASAKVDLNAIARGSLAGYAAAMRRQGIDVVQDMEEPLPEVRGDPLILGQTLNSLVANALEAMPRGGRLHVATRGDRARGTVEVRIADTGHGLADDGAEEAFEPFRTHKHGGLGLGLALSRRVIERLGGTLDLASMEGKGAVATIRMPAAE